jgi:hypothetical protein
MDFIRFVRKDDELYPIVAESDTQYYVRGDLKPHRFWEFDVEHEYWFIDKKDCEVFHR